MQDITVLQYTDRIKLVMKEGKVYSNRLAGERSEVVHG